MGDPNPGLQEPSLELQGFWAEIEELRNQEKSEGKMVHLQDSGFIIQELREEDMAIWERVKGGTVTREELGEYLRTISEGGNSRRTFSEYITHRVMNLRSTRDGMRVESDFDAERDRSEKIKKMVDALRAISITSPNPDLQELARRNFEGLGAEEASLWFELDSLLAKPDLTEDEVDGMVEKGQAYREAIKATLEGSRQGALEEKDARNLFTTFLAVKIAELQMKLYR